MNKDGSLDVKNVENQLPQIVKITPPDGTVAFRDHSRGIKS